MIVDLNITEYIRSLMKEEKNDLSHIESEARVNHVPIVKPDEGTLKDSGPFKEADEDLRSRSSSGIFFSLYEQLPAGRRNDHHD